MYEPRPSRLAKKGLDEDRFDIDGGDSGAFRFADIISKTVTK